MLDLVTRGWKKGETAPLPPDATEQLRLLTAEWLQEQGLTCNTQVTAGQPLALDLLRGLLQVGKGTRFESPGRVELSASIGHWRCRCWLANHPARGRPNRSLERNSTVRCL